MARWTAEEVKELRRMAGRGASMHGAARSLGRSVGSVKGAAVRYGVRFESRKRYDWPALLDMAKGGAGAQECADFSGVTRRRFRAAARSRFGMPWETVVHYIEKNGRLP